jgi:hypothetical protein
MLGAVLYGPRDVRFEERDVPRIINPTDAKSMQTVNDSRTVAPALGKYAQGPLTELSKRPGLTPRDRNIVTIAALIARNQTVEMPYYFNVVGQRETFHSGGGCLAGSLPLVLVGSQ